MSIQWHMQDRPGGSESQSQAIVVQTPVTQSSCNKVHNDLA